MSWLIATAILAPLASAAGSLALRKSPHRRDVITTLGLFAAAAASIAMLVRVSDEGSYRLRVGGWSPELGIELGLAESTVVTPLMFEYGLIERARAHRQG